MELSQKSGKKTAIIWVIVIVVLILVIILLVTILSVKDNGQNNSSKSSSVSKTVSSVVSSISSESSSSNSSVSASSNSSSDTRVSSSSLSNSSMSSSTSSIEITTKIFNNGYAKFNYPSDFTITVDSEGNDDCVPSTGATYAGVIEIKFNSTDIDFNIKASQAGRGFDMLEVDKANSRFIIHPEIPGTADTYMKYKNFRRVTLQTGGYAMLVTWLDGKKEIFITSKNLGINNYPYISGDLSFIGVDSFKPIYWTGKYHCVTQSNPVTLEGSISINNLDDAKFDRFVSVLNGLITSYKKLK